MKAVKTLFTALVEEFVDNEWMYLDQTQFVASVNLLTEAGNDLGLDFWTLAYEASENKDDYAGMMDLYYGAEINEE